ncbi:MAG: hypothetical protein ACRD4X_18550 [Candidatus Acidiferrales bacterium]
MRNISKTGAAMRPAFLAAFSAVAMFPFAYGALAQSQSTYLRWAPSASAASNPSLTYDVYRANSCSGTFTQINSAPVTATVYLDNQPPPGSYCYQVTAMLNGVESSPSNDATATILPLQPQSEMQTSANSSGSTAFQPPASAKQPCSHGGDLIGWLRCVADKARAKIAPPLPVH